jgi:transcription elongation factor Elf1
MITEPEGSGQACIDHLVIDCPDCPQPASTEPDSLACPECEGREFELFLGGRHSGQVACAGCGLMFSPPGPEPELPGETLTGPEQLALPSGCQCSYALSHRDGRWHLVTRKRCPMHRTASLTVQIAPDLPGLPGVPAGIGPVTCPDCGQRTATVHHAPEGNDSYAPVLACRGCGAICELEATAYAAGLAAGVLAEHARMTGKRQ